MKTVEPIEFTSTHTHQTVRHATLTVPQVVRAVREYVARETGVSADDAAVDIGVSDVDGNPLGECDVTVTIDHSLQPRAAA